MKLTDIYLIIVIHLFACVWSYPIGEPLQVIVDEPVPPPLAPIARDSNSSTTNNETNTNSSSSSNSTDSSKVEKEKAGEEDDETTGDGDVEDGDTKGAEPEAGDGPQSIEETNKEIESEEDKTVFEGDLRLDNESLAEINNQTDFRRDVIMNKARHWKDGRVPYTFAGNFDRKRRKVVAKAIKMFNADTCIKFVKKKPSDKDYIQFMIDPKYCYSTSIGKSPRKGRQKISIGRGCEYVGVVLHEMMHAIGFYHEQSRLDRDDYISILWNNIDQNMESQFRKYAHGDADYFGEPYDFKSLMHYPKTAFGKNGATTIVPKNKQWTKLGQRNVFSKTDLAQINKAYGCDKKGSGGEGENGCKPDPSCRSENGKA